MLCQACLKGLHAPVGDGQPEPAVVTHDANWPDSKPHHLSRQSFFDAVAQGCRICALFSREHGLEPDGDEDGDSSPFTVIAPHFRGSDMCFRITKGPHGNLYIVGAPSSLFNLHLVEGWYMFAVVSYV
jgi:hypothetical protein